MLFRSLALKLIEGTKEDRDKYINRTDVLDKVKELTMLPGGKYVDSKAVADYFGVAVVTIRSIRHRHFEEFKSDGVITLKGEEFTKYKNKIALQGATLNGRSSITLYTRRAVLRMGMLLTCSKVADKIRDYLLNVEEQATQEQKEIALSYTGVWTSELDDYVFNSVKNKILNGKMVIEAIRETANEINTTEYILRNRWYVGNKNRKPLKDRLTPDVLKVIEENRALAIYNNHNTNNDEKEIIIPVPKSESTRYIISMSAVVSYKGKVVRTIAYSNKEITIISGYSSSGNFRSILVHILYIVLAGLAIISGYFLYNKCKTTAYKSGAFELASLGSKSKGYAMMDSSEM